jgi:hypothetical protein
MLVDNSAARLYELVSLDLHSLDAEAKAEFFKVFGNDAECFSHETATALGTWEKFRESLDDNDERGLAVAAIAFTAINQQASSFKLFMSGHTVASGSLFRQVIEGVALTLLCSAETLTVLDRFMADKYSTKNAVKDLVKNAKVVHVRVDTVRTLSAAYDFYHKYAHLTKLTIAAGANFSKGGAPNVGAYFDPEKLREYRKEIKNRLSFVRVLPNVVTRVAQNVASW